MENLIGNRFKLESKLKVSLIGDLYRAKDTISNKYVNIRYIPESIFSKEEINILTTLIQKASTLTHRNIALTFGMGKIEGYIYIVQESITGISLTYLLEERLKAKKPFSLRAVYNIVSHIVNGLIYAEKILSHGALSTDNIIITETGRVKIIDFGLAQLLCRKEEFLKGNNGKNRIFIAPELLEHRDISPDPISDIYSIGILIYTLLAGNPPKDIRREELSSIPSITPEVKSLILDLTNYNREKRLKNLLEIKNRFKEAVKIWEESHPKEIPEDDILIEIDLEPVKLIKEPIKATPQPLFKVEEGQIKKSSIEKSPLKKEESSSMLSAPDLPPPPEQKEEKGDKIDLEGLLSNFSKVDVPKWMVQKDNFDHGPFSTREMVQQIMMGNILGHHIAMDMDTGIRKRVDAWQPFVKVVEQYKIQKQKEEEQKALERAQKVEKHGSWLKVVIALGILGVIIAVVIIYFKGLRSQRATEKLSTDKFAELIASGEIKFKGGAGVRSFTRRRRRGGRGEGRLLSAEEAMNKAVDYGDLSGSMRMLTPAQINAVMIKNQRLFYPCLYREYSRRGGYLRVNIDMVIEGSGKVIGVSVPGASLELANCIKAKMRKIKFPSFDAPRMRATYFFEIGE